MYLDYFISLIGIMVFLFTFWRSLKEDYVTSHIFTTAFYSLTGLLLGYLISRVAFGQWWFWTTSLGIVIGLCIGVYRYKLRFYEVLESAVKAYLPWYIILMILNFYKSPEIGEIMMIAIGALLLILFQLLNSHYKNFSWYKSGKIGFAGICVLGVFFLTKAVIAIYFPNMVSFSGSWEVFVSSLAAFFAFLGLFNLARLKS